MNPSSLKMTAMVLITALGASACTPNTSGSVYRPGNALQAQHVSTGTITNVRRVEIRNLPGNSDRVAGAVAGGALGAVLGNEVGDGNEFATGAGAILGALGGDAAARGVNRSSAQEWTVNLDTGGTIAVVQNDPNLFVGQHVRVIDDGRRTRLAP